MKAHGSFFSMYVVNQPKEIRTINFKWTKYLRSVSQEIFTRGKINGSTEAEKNRRNRTGKKGQVKKGRQNWKSRQDRENWTDRQDRQNGTGKTGQAKLDRQNWTG
jgi:hypothetical protein